MAAYVARSTHVTRRSRLLQPRNSTTVGLFDALELVLLLLDTEPNRYSRAALRWHARYCSEVRVDLAEAQAVLSLLAALRGARPKPAAHALADLLHQRELQGASQALTRWAS